MNKINITLYITFHFNYTGHSKLLQSKVKRQNGCTITYRHNIGVISYSSDISWRHSLYKSILVSSGYCTYLIVIHLLFSELLSCNSPTVICIRHNFLKTKADIKRKTVKTLCYADGLQKASAVNVCQRTVGHRRSYSCLYRQLELRL